MIAQVSAFQIFILIGSAQGFILASHILLYHKKESGNKFLAIGIFILSIRLLIYPFRAVSQETVWLFIQNFSLIILLLVGPLFFLFIRKKLNPSGKINSFALLHFTPFLIYSSHVLYPHFQLPVCYSYSTLYSGIFYGILGVVTINKGRIFPALRNHNYYLNSFALPLLIIPASIYGLSYLEKQLFGLHPATFPYLLLTFLFYRMSFRSLNNSRRFFNQLLNSPTRSTDFDPLHMKHLVEVVEKEKLYLNEKISVIDLATHSGFSRHEVSHLINVGAGVSFNMFINNYRIDHVKKKLVDPKTKHLSIVGIARESGFRSKTTFHQVFRDITGMTPGAYQKQFR